jgi:GAF domain-containing protein
MGRLDTGLDSERRERLSQLLLGGVAGQGFAGWARVACEAVCAETGVDGAAMSLRAASHAHLAGASDDWAARLEELQRTLGEGPNHEAFGGHGPALVADLDSERRWPCFCSAAATRGVAAVFAFPLTGSGAVLGTVTLYRRVPRALPASSAPWLAALGELAVTALSAEIAATGGTASAWEAVPAHDDDVHVATGMLAGELGIAVEEASVRLRGYAFTHDRALLAVARAVLGGALAARDFVDGDVGV